MAISTFPSWSQVFVCNLTPWGVIRASMSFARRRKRRWLGKNGRRAQFVLAVQSAHLHEAALHSPSVVSKLTIPEHSSWCRVRSIDTGDCIKLGKLDIARHSSARSKRALAIGDSSAITRWYTFLTSRSCETDSLPIIFVGSEQEMCAKDSSGSSGRSSALSLQNHNSISLRSSVQVSNIHSRTRTSQRRNTASIIALCYKKRTQIGYLCLLGRPQLLPAKETGSTILKVQ